MSNSEKQIAILNAKAKKVYDYIMKTTQNQTMAIELAELTRQGYEPSVLNEGLNFLLRDPCKQ